MRKHYLALFALLLALIPQIHAADAPRRFALIVGVKEYEKDQPLDALPYTENDASELAEVLASGGYDVTLLTQAHAREAEKVRFLPTAHKIVGELDAILEAPGLGENDVVLVAFAGHGMQLSKNRQSGEKIAEQQREDYKRTGGRHSPSSSGGPHH